jgi:hypothetical protein
MFAKQASEINSGGVTLLSNPLFLFTLRRAGYFQLDLTADNISHGSMNKLIVICATIAGNTLRLPTA